ncbi:hypothetical protein BXU11_14625 [Flavobacterium sp. LM5]|uniref:hypothetical protein n=1 Tax=Flavobacterium sp. LM5 TaxID=1938610 RepID=UPI0009934AC7|nr:hypothetical protein [Flavobacterium sp. LM5]OOV25891.1 hypothetical protein BXU11_14625 [Flavobacterium sp. LM5]
MTVIKKTIEFKVSESVDLRKMTIGYFQKSGFKNVDNKNTNNRIIFERGSMSSNLWTFNPLKWKSTIDIEISGQHVKANFNINATGQIPTNKDELLWETFIGNYQKYLLDSKFDFLAENSKNLKTTKRKNLEYICWAALGGLIGGLPAGLIAYWTGINSIVSVGAVMGALTLMTKKITDDKKKNAL